MRILSLCLVFFLSLLLRCWLAPRLDFGVDQRAIYELGKQFYETGIIPAEGPRLVYTGESIPGGFQAVMAGLPLFFSHGEPIGLQIWVGILNACSMLLLFLWLQPKVEPSRRIFLAVFLAFAPWSLLFSPAWNPSFLPVFMVPFFWILDRATRKESPTKNNIEFFALGLIGILCLQLHLSAVLLGLAGLLILPAIRRKLSFFLNVIAGAITGGLFLVPWILKRMQGEASAPLGVIGIHPENLSDIPRAFLRYASFPTSEISRFVTAQGHGFSGMMEVLQNAPLLWIPAAVSMIGSVWMVAVFLRHWWGLRKGNSGFAKMEFALPMLMTLTFLFSIKGASAHTFWILMPLSFYTMTMALSKVALRTWMVSLYLICSLAFSIGIFL